MHRLVRQLTLVGRRCASSATVPKIDKEALMELRRRTRYSFINCRKALQQFGPDRLPEAEKWLHELARKEGWEKATKLSHRSTKAGLVGVATDKNVAAIVEVNCETDFVAKADDFKSLVEKVAKAGLVAARSQPAEDKTLNKKLVDVAALKTTEGKDMKELLAMAVGSLKENLDISRVELIVGPKDSQLVGYSHPKDSYGSVALGQFVAVVGLRSLADKPLSTVTKIGEQLAQHVVGMKPTVMGTMPKEARPDSQLDSDKKKRERPSDEDELNEFYQGDVTHLGDEDALLRQAFMLNPDINVAQFVSGNNIELIDFVRVECGDKKSD